MIDITGNPHDRFFRNSISNKRVAREFFESYLEPAFLEAFDLDTIKHEKENFVDDDLGDGI